MEIKYYSDKLVWGYPLSELLKRFAYHAYYSNILLPNCQCTTITKIKIIFRFKCTLFTNNCTNGKDFVKIYVTVL